MRHLYGTALAAGLTLVMFFGGAWSYLQLLKLPVPPGQGNGLPAGGGSLLSDSTALLAIGVLVLIAVLAGLLVIVPWVSPLASGLAGLLLLGWTALYLVSVRRAVDLIPLRSHAFGAGWEALLFNGILAAAGAVMVFPLFIPSRWRSRAQTRPGASRGASRRDDEDEDEDYLATVIAGSPERSSLDTRSRNEPLVGNVLPRGGPTMPVDTSRVTGASRALRNTGSYRADTRTQPRAAADRGSPRRSGHGGLLGDPYRE